MAFLYRACQLAAICRWKLRRFKVESAGEPSRRGGTEATRRSSRVKLDARVASHWVPRVRVGHMLYLAAIAFCDGCNVATARTERGWRAYVTTGKDGEPSVTIICPACSERSFGDDEAA